MPRTKHRYAREIPFDARRVLIEELVPDRCNFKDNAFRMYVEEFMSTHMPGFPMGLLQTEGEGAYDRWQVQPDLRYKVIRVSATVYICDACDTEFRQSEYIELEDGMCCPNEGLTPQSKDYFVLVDTDYGDSAYVEDAGSDTLEIGDEKVEGWDAEAYDESDAQDKADELDQEASNEGGYGFPWAHSWCHQPDAAITDDELKEAGFKVATYTGGEGGRNDDSFRLCGVDGGGFSFSGSIFASLVYIVSSARNWPIKTDKGEAYFIEKDELTPVEQLSKVEVVDAST